MNPVPAFADYQPAPIKGDFTAKHIVTVDQFDLTDLQILCHAAVSLRRRLRQNDRGLREICAGRIMASLFYESSTRTDLSFQAAMRRLGGDVIAASNGVQFSSVYKGENLSDSVRAAGCYADVVVLRHPEVASSYQAAYYLDMLRQRIERQPCVVSGGDGIGEHPTQALLDLFTIADLKGSVNPLNVDNLTITLVGDLKHGRTVHSLAKLLAKIDADNLRLCFVAPDALKMPAYILETLRQHGANITETANLHEVLDQSDVIYWTRVQEERFANPSDYQAIKDSFVMTPSLLAQTKPDSILMHPLPRKNEMGTKDDHDILDQDKRAVYFQQMENGMLMRMALLAKVLSGAFV